ncbi:NADH-quinone oxidoreductase subunit C [Collinsella sp. AGMB00827]|uniref:NADH-quinone oxidoreductase subunit C n=1 Tax=Collinsella ureilytica TaxID=2869515 RepID=A0ABS7MKE4_9ACTN|nr:NADH-quinone oxidoreductase subunit C [Collinsella urealyticum]MBY4797844.1 NADH-quinone oxidoreductase subunit C [Collinsella urealyticum]
MYTTEFVEISLQDLLVKVQTLRHEGLRFVQLFAERDEQDDFYVLYTFYDEIKDAATTLVVPVAADAKIPSIQGMYFSAFAYENETHDLFGLEFTNMKLDFGGHFFNVATDAPMTILTPEQKAAKDKQAKIQKAAQAKAKAAARARQAAEEKSADRALTTSAAEADAAAVAEVAALRPARGTSDEPSSAEAAGGSEQTQSAAPDKPAAPTQAATSAAPIVSAEPAVPATPAAPAVPAEPTEPVEPAVEPAVPTESIREASQKEGA